MTSYITFTLCGVGIILILIAIAIMLFITIRRRRCTAMANATIMDIKARYVSRTFQTVYSPVYEYFVNSVRYTRKGAADKHDTLQVGSIISIAYDPYNPQRAYIPKRDDKNPKVVAAVCSFFGILLITTGIYLATL